MVQVGEQKAPLVQANFLAAIPLLKKLFVKQPPQTVKVPEPTPQPEWFNTGAAGMKFTFYDENNTPLYSETMAVGNISPAAWGRLVQKYDITQNGTIEVELFNYNTTPAYFDDWHIELTENSKPEIVQEVHYDPWGLVMEDESYFAPVSPANGADLFNGKELQTFADLNFYDYHWRQYDPQLGRWHSPDPADQFHGISGYAYCANNPVMLNDPDGRVVWFVPILIGLGKAIAIGAGISAATYTASVAFSQGGFNNWSWSGFGNAVLQGAISGAISYGVGSIFGGVGASFNVGKELSRAYVHGFANGMVSEFSGGSFMSGFASGAFGSFTGSLTGIIGNPALQVGVSALAGGVGAEISGGNFWLGFATGGIIAATNHLMHQDPPTYEYNGKVYTSKAELYSAILADQTMEQSGIKDIMAGAAVISGQPLLQKRFIAKGSSHGTSLASTFFNKILPFKSPVRIPTPIANSSRIGFAMTKSVGKIVGRWIPFVGWGILAYDAGKILYNTQIIYNRITQNR